MMNRPAFHKPHATSDRQRGPRRAFTLIELLVVLGLIVLALAAAVPAFNAITNSRSTDAGENVAAAMLQRARTVAIQSGVPTGVLFFINPADQRATMALITQAAGEGVYSNYRGWTDFSYQQTPSGLSTAPLRTDYAFGHDVVALNMVDAMPPTPPTGTPPNPSNDERYRHSTRSFTHDNTTTQVPPPTAATPWVTADVTYDLLPDNGFETLPANVALQTINDPKGLARDHYLQTGVILFDSVGRCVSLPYKFKRDSAAYNLIRAATTNINFIPESTNPATTLYSQVGLVLYDRSAFLNQTSTSGPFTEGDPSYKTGGTFAGTDLLSIPGPTGSGQETAEEAWLDKETTPLLVNRGNGALMRGQ